jgi:hypothetical protein
MAVEKDKDTNAAGRKGAASVFERPEIIILIFWGQFIKKHDRPENRKFVLQGQVWLAFDCSRKGCPLRRREESGRKELTQRHEETEARRREEITGPF